MCIVQLAAVLHWYLSLCIYILCLFFLFVLLLNISPRRASLKEQISNMCLVFVYVCFVLFCVGIGFDLLENEFTYEKNFDLCICL